MAYLFNSHYFMNTTEYSTPFHSIRTSTYWHDLIFSDTQDTALKDSLYELLKIEGDGFFKDYYATQTLFTITENEPPATNQEQAKILNDWYFSDTGQQILLDFVQDFWQLLHKRAKHSMPAHDARHALYKVPAFSLKYIESEKVTGFERLGLIGAMGHDYGRWGEEHVFGNAGNSVVHTRMSFVLVREFMQPYPIPHSLQQEILYSILRHTTGAKAHDNMIVKLVVSPDRDQLIGPESALRLTHHKPAPHVLDTFYPETYEVHNTKPLADSGKPEDSQHTHKTRYNDSVLDRISHYYFSRLPGPLFSLPDVAKLYQAQYTFLYLALDSTTLTHFTQKYVSKKYDLHGYEDDISHAQTVYEYKKQWIEEARPDVINHVLSENLMELLSSANACPTPEYLDMALNKLGYMNESENLSEDQYQQKARLAVAFQWINEKRKDFDQQQYADLQRIASSNEKDQWLYWVATQLQKGWF